MSQLGLVFVVFVLSVSRSDAKQGADSDSGLTKFLSVLCGSYSNREEKHYEQDNGNGIDHSLIEALLNPVDIPELYPAYSVYFQEQLDNVVTRAQILAVTEPEVNIFHLQPYDLSNSSVITSGGFDQSSPSSINFADLTFRPECLVTYETIEDSVYVANWPSCMTPEKNQVSYTITLTCKSLSFASFEGLYPEKSSKVPYIIKKIKSLPLLPYMRSGVENVTNPCEK